MEIPGGMRGDSLTNRVKELSQSTEKWQSEHGNQRSGHPGGGTDPPVLGMLALRGYTGVDALVTFIME